MTTAFRDVAERLRALHDHDLKIQRLERDIHDGPARLDGLQTRVGEVDRKIRAVNERVMVLRAQIKLRENELKSAEQKIERVKAQSSEVRTNKEFMAFKAELSNFQADADRLSGEILKIMEVVDQAAKKTEALEAERGQALGRVEASRTKLDAGLEGVKKQREQLLGERKALLEGIPKPQLEIYERIHRSRGDGVAFLEGEYCGACMERLTRNDAISVQNATRLIQCRGCNRILLSP